MDFETAAASLLRRFNFTAARSKVAARMQRAKSKMSYARLFCLYSSLAG